MICGFLEVHLWCGKVLRLVGMNLAHVGVARNSRNAALVSMIFCIEITPYGTEMRLIFPDTID
jgi:hypothetical protein